MSDDRPRFSEGFAASLSSVLREKGAVFTYLNLGDLPFMPNSPKHYGQLVTFGGQQVIDRHGSLPFPFRYSPTPNGGERLKAAFLPPHNDAARVVGLIYDPRLGRPDTLENPTQFPLKPYRKGRVVLTETQEGPGGARQQVRVPLSHTRPTFFMIDSNTYLHSGEAPLILHPTKGTWEKAWDSYNNVPKGVDPTIGYGRRTYSNFWGDLPNVKLEGVW